MTRNASIITGALALSLILPLATGTKAAVPPVEECRVATEIARRLVAEITPPGSDLDRRIAVLPLLKGREMLAQWDQNPATDWANKIKILDDLDCGGEFRAAGLSTRPDLLDASHKPTLSISRLVLSDDAAAVTFSYGYVCGGRCGGGEIGIWRKEQDGWRRNKVLLLTIH